MPRARESGGTRTLHCAGRRISRPVAGRVAPRNLPNPRITTSPSCARAAHRTTSVPFSSHHGGSARAHAPRPATHFTKTMKTKYGIQGGPGSFNDEAARSYLRKKRRSGSISYLYTTEAVLRALKRGKIKYGQFAIVNGKGGLVEETLSVLGKYPFRVADNFSMPIRHCLLARKDAPAKMTAIMGHPQALKQCDGNLARYYPRQKKMSGRGTMIDPSKAAEALAKGDLPSTVAVLGPAGLASIFGLKILRRNLQDDPKNRTAFLVVQRLD